MSDRRRRAFRIPTDDATRPREVSDEVRFHLERKVEGLVRRGMSEADAWAEATSRFGDVEGVKQRMIREGGRMMWWTTMWDRIRQDLHYAVRQALRGPGFTTVTALTLALGIGATTAIFSVADGILFRPLPFPESDELVAVWADWTRRGGPSDEWMNFANYFDLKERSRTLEAVAAFDWGGTTVTGVGEAERITAGYVSDDMFTEVLLVEPAVGRTFTAEDDRPGADPTAMITDAFWSRALGAAPDAVGSTIELNDVPHVIVGILPASFQPPFASDAEVWLPLRVDRADNYCGRGGACMHAVARIADGVTLEEARAEAADIGAALEREYPEANANAGINIVRLQDDVVADARPSLLLLLAAVGCVLLIACVNVANLLLARGSSRSSEIAVRSALGAGRPRLAAQLLTESALLAAVGGALGLLLASFGTNLLVATAPVGTPRIESVGMNMRVLSFSFGTTAFAGLLFATVPALRAARGSLGEGLRSGSPRAGGESSSIRGRGVLVSSQVALALVLLVTAGLLLQSFRNLRAEDLGFVPERLLTAEIGLPAPRYPDSPERREFVSALEDRLAALPGVEAVGATSWLPLRGPGADTDFEIEGRPPPPAGQGQSVWFRRITVDYPAAMGMTLVAGRWFSPGDDESAPRVVVINEGMARRYFPDRSPVGQRINLNSPDNPIWREIVGVASDVRYFGIRNDSRDALYIPYAQSPSPGFTVAMRSSRDLSGLAGEVRGVVAEIDPALALGAVQPMTAIVESALGPERFVTLLTTLFGALAFALAVVGLYGVVSYGVSRRLREMGVRLALGAGGGDIEGLVLRQSLAFVAIGLVVGLVGAIQLTRLMGDLLFGVSATDPWTYVLAVVVFAGVAAAAAAIPARRAARVDPVRVLRAE